MSVSAAPAITPPNVEPDTDSDDTSNIVPYESAPYAGPVSKNRFLRHMAAYVFLPEASKHAPMEFLELRPVLERQAMYKKCDAFLTKVAQQGPSFATDSDVRAAVECALPLLRKGGRARDIMEEAELCVRCVHARRHYGIVICKDQFLGNAAQLLYDHVGLENTPGAHVMPALDALFVGLARKGSYFKSANVLEELAEDALAQSWEALRPAGQDTSFPKEDFCASDFLQELSYDLFYLYDIASPDFTD